MAPRDFLWLADVDEATLEKVDRIFVAELDRSPGDDADFRLNGPYHRICQSLQHDPHYYDNQLGKPSQATDSSVHIPVRSHAGASVALREPSQAVNADAHVAVTRSASVDRQASKEPSQPVSRDVPRPATVPLGIAGETSHSRRIWPFVALVVSGFCCLSLMALLIAALGQKLGPAVVLLLGSLWLGMLFILLVLILPKESHQGTSLRLRAATPSRSRAVMSR
jgi:hypothetical protein